MVTYSGSVFSATETHGRALRAENRLVARTAGTPRFFKSTCANPSMESAVSEMYGCDASKAEIVPRFAILDPLLEQLAITITTALRDGTVEDGLYVDTLAHMIAVHLARRHSSRPARSKGLPPERFQDRRCAG